MRKLLLSVDSEDHRFVRGRPNGETVVLATNSRCFINSEIRRRKRFWKICAIGVANIRPQDEITILKQDCAAVNSTLSDFALRSQSGGVTRP